MAKSSEIRPLASAFEREPVPLVVWAARASLYFLVQGAFILLAYAYYGFDTDPDRFPPGFKLDPTHAAVHLVWGLAGTYIGFCRPRLTTTFIFAFAAFYTALAVLGTFTTHHLGMKLDWRVNLFHWALVPPAWAIGLYGLWQAPRPR